MRRKQLYTYAAYLAVCFVVLYGFVNYYRPSEPSSGGYDAHSKRVEGGVAGQEQVANRNSNKGNNAKRGFVDANKFGRPDTTHLHGVHIGFTPIGQPAWGTKPMPEEKTFEDKRNHHYKNCFNLPRSDSLELDRPIPDTRDKRCQDVKYDLNTLPSTSVIFVFFNEPLSPLYRSIHSVLNRTPPELLHEIVLVDDGSDAEWLKDSFEEYLSLLPKVILTRMPKREGLMAARTRGAEVATGKIITFLDSHIEVNQGWLEPLLARIASGREHVVMPIIDTIDADSFEYRSGGLDILGFSWSLGQKGVGNRKISMFDPNPSPVMAGGLFSMDRALFFELGKYDPEMKLYGGEEMEISFRLWQCGNTLECIPCSRVGHVFRTGDYWKGQVYPVPMDVIIRNKLRAAEVWMDEYKDIAKRLMGPLPPGKDIGPLDYMIDIRTRLKCKSFKWYLENVYPELFIPNDPRYTKKSGALKNIENNVCFDSLGASETGTTIAAYPCHGRQGTQHFVLSTSDDIRLASHDYDICLDSGGGDSVKIWGCHGQGGNQKFEYNADTQQIVQYGHRCIEAKKKTSGSGYSLSMAPCDKNAASQKWIWS